MCTEYEPTVAPPMYVSDSGWIEDVVRLVSRSEEHTSELQSRLHLVCRLLLEQKKMLISVLLAGSASPDSGTGGAPRIRSLSGIQVTGYADPYGSGFSIATLNMPHDRLCCAVM